MMQPQKMHRKSLRKRPPGRKKRGILRLNNSQQKRSDQTKTASHNHIQHTKK